MGDKEEHDTLIWKTIESYMRDVPQYLVRHHIESYNDFFHNGIYQIFRDKNPMSFNTDFDETQKIYRHQCHFYFGGKSGKRIYFGKPTIVDNGNVHYMYPNEARLRDMHYSMTVHYDIEIEYIRYTGQTELGQIEEDGFTEESDEEPDKEPEMSKKREKTREEKYRLIEGRTKEGTKKGTKKGGAPKFTIESTEEIKMVYLGKIPIMVQSDFCILSQLPKEVRFSLGECRNEQGGYFIVSGKEKVIISQEKFADNMLYIRESADDHYTYSAEIRSVSENVSKPIRTLSVKIMKPTGKYTYENIVVMLPNITRPVPLFILFRALGILSDKEIIQYCLLDFSKYSNMIDLFAPSVQDAGSVYTQHTALHYISQLLIKNRTPEKTLEILADYFLPHIGEMNFKEKAHYLGYMVFRLLSVKTHIEPPTNRDNFKYKRMETAGSLISDLFREYYNIQFKRVHKLFEEQYKAHSKGLYEKNLVKLVADHHERIFTENRILETGFLKAFKGNWGAEAHTKRIGLIQDLNRLSFNSAMSHLRKTNVPIDASMKIVGPRLLNNTQWGYLDPIDTPDGGHIGIHKNLSLFTCITKGISREPMISWLRQKTDMKLLADCNIATVATTTKVMVNGCWVGLTQEPLATVDKIKLFRRNALIPIYISATFDIGQNTVFICTDAGRLTRPIFYVDKKGDLSFSFKEGGDSLNWEKLISGTQPKKIHYSSNDTKFYELDDLYSIEPNEKDNFIRENTAHIDYIDTSESENALIAIRYEDWVKNRKTIHYTHCEIHEALTFGPMFQLIVFPEHNAQQRDLFSCGQSKQAVSLYHTNYHTRMDKNGVVLNAGQIPLVKSRFLEPITGEENMYGQNTIVAIMSHTGYNVEDSILFNEGSLNRGLFRTTYYNTYQTFEEKSKMSDVLIEKTFTNVLADGRVIKNKPGYDYSHLDERGIVKEGTKMNDKIIMIGLTSNDTTNPDKRIDASIPSKKGQLGIVDKTFVTEGEEGHRIAKVRIREERIPALGDKMASRAGQKGTVGMIVPERDMPFTKNGLRPDIIINPHAIPSRMTIGQLLESLLAKGATLYGAFGDCTAFNNQDINKVKSYGQHLNTMGYHSTGNEIMYNGMTGEQIEMEIFMGPTYYMRLKHMVKDKVNYRALGPNEALTRQPVSGRANDGGLRVGEMERDSMAGHGISHFLKESMMERADKYYMAVCNQTGLLAIYNPSKNIFMSPMADGPLHFTGTTADELRLEKITKFGRSFSIVSVPYTMKLFIQELQAMNIQMRIITEDNIEQFENLSLSSKTLGQMLNDETSSLEQLIHKIGKGKVGGGKTEGKMESIVEEEDEDKKDDNDDKKEKEAKDDDKKEKEANAKDDDEEEKDDEHDKKDNDYDKEKDNDDDKDEEEKDTKYKPLSFIELDTDEKEEEQDKEEQQDKGEQPSFRLGEPVYLMGDTHTGRVWKIKSVGHKFATIETDETEDLDKTIQVVPFLYLTKMRDIPFQQPPVGDPIPMPMPMNTTPMMYPQPPTSINIKFVNGADHSIAQDTIPATDVYNTDVYKSSDPIPNTVIPSSSPETTSLDSGEIDFSKKLVIQKL
jgi:DNA-directed RNA polymerase II subunit RPB2